jgi:hypothetical protein
MLMDSQLCNKPQCRDSGFVQSHHARQQQKSAKVVLELARAQLAQITAETRVTNTLWVAYCFRRVVFWTVVIALLATCAKAEAQVVPYPGLDREALSAGPGALHISTRAGGSPLVHR